MSQELKIAINRHIINKDIDGKGTLLTKGFENVTITLVVDDNYRGRLTTTMLAG